MVSRTYRSISKYDERLWKRKFRKYFPNAMLRGDDFLTISTFLVAKRNPSRDSEGPVTSSPPDKRTDEVDVPLAW